MFKSQQQERETMSNMADAHRKDKHDSTQSLCHHTEKISALQFLQRNVEAHHPPPIHLLVGCAIVQRVVVWELSVELGM